MAILLSDLRDAFETYKYDISDVDSDAFVQWCDFVNRFAYEKIAKIDPETFLETDDYSIDASPKTLAMPTDLWTISSPKLGFYYFDAASVLHDVKLYETGPGSELEGFYNSGTDFIFTGITNKDYKLKYLPKAPHLTDLTDYLTSDGTVTGTPIFEDRHLDFLIKVLDVYYEQWDEDPGAESLADFRFVRMLSDMLEKYRKTPHVLYTYDYSTEY